MVRRPALAQYMATFQLDRQTRSSLVTDSTRLPDLATLHMRRHLESRKLASEPGIEAGKSGSGE